MCPDQLVKEEIDTPYGWELDDDYEGSNDYELVEAYDYFFTTTTKEPYELGHPGIYNMPSLSPYPAASAPLPEQVPKESLPPTAVPTPVPTSTSTTCKLQYI